MSKAPLRDVVEVRELEGERGGRILVMRLACGHLIWNRRKRPPMRVGCVPCWWDEGPSSSG